MRRLFGIGAGFLLAALVAAPAFAIPKILNYQGRLNDKSGQPVNGTVSMTFTIWSAETGGIDLWHETKNVVVTGGLFNVRLGVGTTPFPDTIFDNDVTYLGIKVQTDDEMTPRQQVASTAYAFKSMNSETSDRLLGFLGLSNLRNMQLGTSDLGAGQTDGWGEIYSDADGKGNSVQSAGTTALRDNDKYHPNLYDQASGDTTHNPSGFSTPLAAFDGDDLTSAYLGGGGYLGKTFSAKYVNSCFVKISMMGFGGTNNTTGARAYIQTYDGTTWKDKEEIARVTEGSISTGKYIRVGATVQGIRVYCQTIYGGSGSEYSFSIMTLKYGDDSDGIINHAIPANMFPATIRQSIGIPLIAGWEDGSDIEYKLTNATEDSGWLSAGNNPMTSTFPQFTSEPTYLTVRLIHKNGSTVAGYPSIKGFWVYAE